MTEYLFFKLLDSYGFDIEHIPGKSIDELKKICESKDNCIAFNSMGILKYDVTEFKDFVKAPIYTNNTETDGLYIHKKKFEAKREKDCTYKGFDGYTFVRGMDSPGGDIHFERKNLYEMKLKADSLPNCEGFNTLGFFKCIIGELKKSPYFREKDDGIYIKNEFYNSPSKPNISSLPKKRVKLLCNWCTSRTLCDEWNHMTKGAYTWNDFQITWENDADYFVIINKPLNDQEFYIPHRTIVFQMEPWCGDTNQNWGVKTWGKWAEPDPKKFLQVRTHRNFYNNAFWQLKTTYNEFKTEIIKKTKLISTITSSKYFDPGHIKRIDFLKFIETKNDFKIDIYNYDNRHNFKNYVGPHPPGNKDAGMKEYKYYFMVENNYEKNFITEKIWEPILCESLCFYFGCPNISDWIDPRAYILLDMDDFEKSYQIIKTSIENNEWEKRREILRIEKQKILEYYQFFPTVERVIKDYEFESEKFATNIYDNFVRDDIKNYKHNNVCFIHSCTINNNTMMLDYLMDKIIKSKMIDTLDKIYVLNLGNIVTKNYAEKVKILNYSKNTKLFEVPTINLIHYISTIHPNLKILYLHTKGITHGRTVPPPNVMDWNNLMLYFLVEKGQIANRLLDNYDTVGVNKAKQPYHHFSGNFWWARSSYIRTLKPLTYDCPRHECEWWILTNANANPLNLFSSNINHYQCPYPREQYDNPKTNEILSAYVELEELKNNLMYDSDNNEKDYKIMVVNLKRRPDRKLKMIKEFNNIGIIKYNFYEAVDGTSLHPDKDLLKMFEGNDFGSRRTFIGCALSHVTLWKNLVQDKEVDKYLIFEDDVTFVEDFKNKLDNVIMNLPVNDITYLGYFMFPQNLEKNKDVYRNNNFPVIKEYDHNLSIGGFFAYLITKRGAKKMLDFIEKNGIKHGIDYLPKRYHKEIGLEQHECQPHIVLAEYVVNNLSKVDSDIQYDYAPITINN